LHRIAGDIKKNKGGAPMDPQKIVAFAQNYVRDYVLTFLSILAGRFTASDGPGTADHELTFTSTRLWSFVVISLLIGQLAFLPLTAGAEHNTRIGYSQPLLTLWLWILFAGVSHWLLALFGSDRPFTASSAICLRILSAIYVITCLTSLTVFVLAGGSGARHPAPLGAAVGLTVQFLLMTLYLPPALWKGRQLSLPRKSLVLVALPLIVLVINIVGVGLLLNNEMLRPVPLMVNPHWHL
jgi:hypothetical protein